MPSKVVLRITDKEKRKIFTAIGFVAGIQTVRITIAAKRYRNTIPIRAHEFVPSTAANDKIGKPNEPTQTKSEMGQK